MQKLGRRIFILGGAAAVAATTLPLSGAQGAAALAALAYPFKLGITSGDPLPDGVVLWTRLATSPLNTDGQGGMPNRDVLVDWQVSTNDLFTAVVASGSVTATYAAAHSVHVEVGGLNPDYEYFYRFRAEGHISPVGRTRTAPAFNTVGRNFTMAFASCAHFESGYYTAYRRMAEDRPDVILHLGDYIYEGGTGTTGVRRHVGSEIVSLANYRTRYAQYKSDQDLQAAHAIAPWIVVPDDHEVENNYAGMIRANNDPALTAAQWTARRAAAYRAYYENMPLRAASLPSGADALIYRRIRWGQLATFHMLDTRQYRTDQACDDGTKVCPAANDPARTLPGLTQENWLLDGLGQHLGTWDFIGQQVFFARKINASGATSMDAWDGYTASRARLQNGWVARQVRNPIVLTGDVHKSWASNIKADYANPASATIGTELVTTSVSSGGDGTGTTTIPDAALNPHIKFHSDRRGYVRTSITPTGVTVNFRSVSSVTEHGAAASTTKSFAIDEGQPGLRAL
jgi:alkaline phosphatase D